MPKIFPFFPLPLPLSLSIKQPMTNSKYNHKYIDTDSSVLTQIHPIQSSYHKQTNTKNTSTEIENEGFR